MLLDCSLFAGAVLYSESRKALHKLSFSERFYDVIDVVFVVVFDVVFVVVVFVVFVVVIVFVVVLFVVIMFLAERIQMSGPPLLACLRRWS